MKNSVLPAINIQFPISELILSGKKTIETRTYALPEKYIERDLYLIETPGSNGAFKARAVAVIRFGKSFQYASKKEFYKDQKLHCVDQKSKWAWKEKAKWGWPVLSVTVLDTPLLPTGRRGIVFSNSVRLK